jgi:hypothetical protein
VLIPQHPGPAGSGLTRAALRPPLMLTRLWSSPNTLDRPAQALHGPLTRLSADAFRNLVIPQHPGPASSGLTRAAYAAPADAYKNLVIPQRRGRPAQALHGPLTRLSADAFRNLVIPHRRRRPTQAGLTRAALRPPLTLTRPWSSPNILDRPAQALHGPLTRPTLKLTVIPQCHKRLTQI